jgi:dienelactone hydrolase
MRIRIAAAVLALLALSASNAAADTASRFHAAVDSILAQPYQPDYVPSGDDAAFGPANVLNTFPAEDYTSGSIPGSPDAPAWPPWFTPVGFTSADGAPLLGELGLHPGTAPAVVVVHGFNTHGYASVIRWAAMLYANGYDVLAADQRDFSFEYSAGEGYPAWQQTFGWKEAEDVLAAGRYLDSRKGVHGKAGLVGFSEGGQNTVLALALDRDHRVFSAGLQFSGPADQDTQIYSTAVPSGCSSPLCTYPATDALVALVVPPYDMDVCTAIASAATLYATSGFGILSHETAAHAQAKVSVPLLSFYSADDSLVPPFEAQMMAGYEVGNPLQATYEVARGEHAYFFDRWWQQRAILLYFKAMIPEAQSDSAVTTAATVNQTSGGPAFGDQLVPLAGASRAATDALLAPYICDTSRGVPGLAGG